MDLKKLFLFMLAVMLLFSVGCSDNANDAGDANGAGDAPVYTGQNSPNEATDLPESDPESNTDSDSVAELPESVELLPIVVSAGVVTDDFSAITAVDWVANVRVGWNLGNTLDTYSGGSGFSWLGGGVYANTTVAEMETAWGNPITTRENFETLREAGFNAVRIPVTWNKAADEQYIIREDWMARVTQVVNYALDSDMKVLLNSHHDNAIFRLHDIHMDDSKIAMERIWTQIAYAFRDYDEMLVFEGLNEPRTIGTPAEWTGGTEEERDNLNILNQLFVDTVRSTGGNNAYRVLMIPTYAASASANAQRALVIPTDSVEDKIIVSLHMYSPWEFALRTGPEGVETEWSRENPEDTRPITGPLDMAYNLFVSNGIPVIFDEMGALNRDNEEARAEWVEFYMSHARSLGIPCFWWDNGEYWPSQDQGWGWDETFGLLNRRTNEFEHPMIIEAIMRATE
ncbi:MAG: glycoside hydrolase family 5 protein [Defluviitaleaceae bacterium]|nr:glycoside hydrolase family 5 protein [Defluviitaleaceae bacterium]